MVRVVAVLLLMLAACLPAIAKPKPFIEIKLETREAFLGDTVVIEVRWSGLLDPIDFSPLERDAEKLRETTGTRIAVVEGQVIEIASRRIELQTRVVGLLTLGPLEADGVTSNSVSIEVTEPRTVLWVPGKEDVQLTQTVSEARPWLQQQLVLNIQLRTRHPVFDEVAILPAFDGFRVVPVFTERRTLDEADGGWAKTAWRYLLFPQHSGSVTIPGARFAGTQAKSRAERGSFDLTAPPTRLDVQPSAFGSETWWTAASGLTLKDEWSRDPTGLSAGDEVERTITVAATGVLPEQIADVVMDETRGLAITPLGVERHGKIIGDEAQATARFRFRIRAMSPVPVFLDTVRLRWWNVVDNRAAEAIIPARRIDIAVPDRQALVDDALAEQSLWEQLRMAAARYDSWAYTVLAVLVILMASAGVILTRSAPVDAWFEARRLARELGDLARRGDVPAFHQRLRVLATTQPGVAPVYLELERQLFTASGAAPDLNGLAGAVRHALRRTMRAGRNGETLPGL